MTEAPRGLSQLPLPDLERLRRLLAALSSDDRITDSWLRSSGFTHFADVLASLFGSASVAAALMAVDVAIAERVHRPPPRLKLVWTGPDSQGSTARDTAMLVSELFETARHEVIVAGFRFDHGSDIFAPLHRGMCEHGLKASVFIDIDISGEAKTVSGAEDYARRAVQAFLRWNWPFGDPHPAVYFDPRTALPGPPWVSLHAKCIVVDERLTFITSANFTERGQARNIELGVLLDDREFAGRVAAQWWTLVRGGLVHEAGVQRP
jgi:hypothetical protein